MDIKNKLFKFKRAFRRNRETIAKVFSTTLTIALLLGVAWGAYTIYQSDLAYEAEMNKPVESENEVETGKTPTEDRTPEAFRLVADKDGMKLYANFTNGEIKVVDKNGTEWYSNPVDRASAAKPVKKPMINSQIHLTFFDVGNKVPISEEWNNYAHSIRKGGMTYELLKDGSGVKFIFAFPIANVIVPVQYRIVDGAFQAEILNNEIKSVGENPYRIVSIKLLPYFGAANQSTDGELLIPDGSGALIKFNNGKNHNDIIYYNAPVYGKNITLTQDKAEPVKEQANLPIFGSKWVGKDGKADSAFLGVIISGDSSANIVASTSDKISSYNMIHATANMAEYVHNKVDGSVFAGQSTNIMAISDNLLSQENFAVRYYFLGGEDANYVGMAEQYREHLEKVNQLKKTALADKKYLVLDLVGAVSIEKYVFGIKQPVVTALTSYNDVVTIVKELKAEGVDNLVINYIGALNGGLNNMMYSSVKTESVLGSEKDFRAMIDYLNQEGVLFFLETNPVDIYNNGNGYDNNADTTKTFFNKYAFQYNYVLDSEQKSTERWHILHPAKVSGFVDKFATSAQSNNIGGISLDRLGEVLYTDYADDVPSTTRSHSLGFWKEALKIADEKSNNLLVHGGNAYTLAYADVIADIANGSSDYDMEDATVPFYQIAFQGSTVLAPSAFNMSVDYERELLRVLENGTNLKYNLIYGDVDQLVGTEYNTMVSYSYTRWKEKIVAQYKTLQDATAQFAGKEIIGHEIVDLDVTVTEYENGKVVVNYRSEAYTYEGTEIPAKHYVVLEGGTK